MTKVSLHDNEATCTILTLWYVAVEPLEFAPQLLERIKPHVGFYATNFGSFVIVALTEVPSTSSKMKKLLKPHKKDIQQAASENNAGAKILIELL